MTVRLPDGRYWQYDDDGDWRMLYSPNGTLLATIEDRGNDGYYTTTRYQTRVGAMNAAELATDGGIR